MLKLLLFEPGSDQNIICATWPGPVQAEVTCTLLIIAVRQNSGDNNACSVTDRSNVSVSRQ
jgi:hypothetical protein